MEPVSNDIDRPLGQDKRPPGGPREWPRAGSVVLVLLGLALFGGSTAIALRERPFRNPPEVAISTPEAASAEKAKGEEMVANTTSPDSGSANSSPSIIHVGPDASPAGNNVIVIRDPSSVSRNLRIAHLPDRALIEESELGPLPVRAADGRRPFDVY